MPTDKSLIKDYLYQQYEMSPEEVERHEIFVERELARLEKEFWRKHKKLPKKETVIGVAFSPVPIPRHRIIEPQDYKNILNYKTRYSLADDKKEFPSIFDNEFVFGIKTTKRELFGRVYKRYKWNNADIIGIIQLIAMCSKDDRRIILASGLHDFLLEYKYEIYNKWFEQDDSLSVDEFRWITSDTFRWLCEEQGFRHTKAVAMANIMDCFQKHIKKKKWEIEIES